MSQPTAAFILQPKEMANAAAGYAYDKVVKKPATSFFLAISAGIFIAIAFVFYTTVTTGSGASWGQSRFLGGFAFSLGLIFVVICGGELFTSTVLSAMARASKSVSTKQLLTCWGRVYLGNMVGSLFMVALVMIGGMYHLDGGQWGITALNTAQHKLHHGFAGAFVLGIMCNMLVCLGIWMTFSAQNALTKAFMVILPVTMFVSSGFEHCVANMFMVPLGISIHQFADASFWSHVGIAPSQYADLTIKHFILNNLIPVTLGNIVGGAVFVGLGYWAIFHPERKPVEPSTPSVGSARVVTLNHHSASTQPSIAEIKTMTRTIQSLKVKQIMDTAPSTLTSDMSLTDALNVMLNEGVTGMAVINAQRCVIGFVSEQDILRQLWSQDFVPTEPCIVENVMREDIITVGPDDAITELAEYMSVDKEKLFPVSEAGVLTRMSGASYEERLAQASVNRPKVYPVVENGQLLGVVSRRQILLAMSRIYNGKPNKAVVTEAVTQTLEAQTV
jgi:formate transporter FocA